MCIIFADFIRRLSFYRLHNSVSNARLKVGCCHQIQNTGVTLYTRFPKNVVDYIIQWEYGTNAIEKTKWLHYNKQENGRRDFRRRRPCPRRKSVNDKNRAELAHNLADRPFAFSTQTFSGDMSPPKVFLQTTTLTKIVRFSNPLLAGTVPAESVT